MNQKSGKSRHHKGLRYLAREIAVQSIYEWQLTANEVTEIMQRHCQSERLKKIDRGFLSELVVGTTENVVHIDKNLSPFLDRKIEEIDPMERAILRLGAFELIFKQNTPWRVIINECIELAHVFAGEQSFRYINGVLDKLAYALRQK